MTRSDHREPIKFVGMYFIDEHGEDYRTGQIIAQISDGYYLAQFDCTDDNVPPAPLEVMSTVDFSKVCDNCGSRHWQFFPDVKTRQRWITWLNTPDPAKDKMGKVVHLKPIATCLSGSARALVKRCYRISLSSKLRREPSRR
jgi:hypothetical protein